MTGKELIHSTSYIGMKRQIESKLEELKGLGAINEKVKQYILSLFFLGTLKKSLVRVRVEISW
ncbi:MAG: hypothetical protein ACW98I_19620 [Candidatus Hodarchaeales archaeon]|jgi:hypothetical protein